MGRGPRQADWWALATTWRSAGSGAPHGEMASRIDAVSRTQDRRPNTIRRAAAAKAFAEALQQNGLIEDAAALRGVSISNMESLQRVSRYGREPLLELLPQILNGGLTKAEARDAEKKLRAAAEADTAFQAEGGNAHLLRLRGKPFKTVGLEEMQKHLNAVGHKSYKRGTLPTSAILIPTDAVFCYDETWIAVRVVVESLGEVRDRMRSILHLALAGARVFDRYEVIFQSPKDAKALADVLKRYGRCGVGSSWIDLSAREDRVVTEYVSTRDSPCDLLYVREHLRRTGSP